MVKVKYNIQSVILPDIILKIIVFVQKENIFWSAIITQNGWKVEASFINGAS